MKRPVTRRAFTILLAASIVSALSAALLAATVPAAHAANPNPGVIPPGASPYGTSYGNWGAAWWTWAYGIPPDENPVLDPDGTYCDVGQSGSVWFLAGTFGAEAQRSCTTPAGKGIFFPILDVLWFAPDDLTDALWLAETFELAEDPSSLSDEDLLALVADWHLSYVVEDSLTVNVDGVEFEDLESYRAQSDPFDFYMRLREPQAAKGPAISDGYWIMLAPLSVGEHTVEFGGIMDLKPFDIYSEIHVSYDLDIVPHG